MSITHLPCEVFFLIEGEIRKHTPISIYCYSPKRIFVWFRQIIFLYCYGSAVIILMPLCYLSKWCQQIGEDSATLNDPSLSTHKYIYSFVLGSAVSMLSLSASSTAFKSIHVAVSSAIAFASSRSSTPQTIL